MNIVLVEPEIPPNTGNIARTCAATGANLHLVRPLGFSTADRYLKRAGLDYWDLVDVRYYNSIQELMEEYPKATFYFASTKSKKTYAEIEYKEDDFLVFGKETKGLDEDLLRENYDNCIRIPMTGPARSLNLSNAVAIVLYEALRQRDFESLKKEGQLRNDK